MALLARVAFDQNSTLALIGALACIVVAAHFFMKLLSYQVTAALNALWIGLGTLLITVVSYFLFHEAISLQQGIAMLVIVLGVVLVGYEGAPNLNPKK